MNNSKRSLRPNKIRFAIDTKDEKTKDEIMLELESGRITLGEEKYLITEIQLKEMLLHADDLGSGAQGDVKRINFHNHSIAVKQIKIDDLNLFKQALKELNVLRKVKQDMNFQYIVRYFGYVIVNEPKYIYIFMEELIMCLDKFQSRIKTFPESIVGNIAFDVINALNYLKENHQIIHRDVKPSNMLIDKEGNIKLSDFAVSGELNNSVAKTKTLRGHFQYLAPERIDESQNSVYDARSDVWSLGISLYQLATGKHLYSKLGCDENNEFVLLSFIEKHEPPRLTLEETTFSTEFCDFLNNCLVKNPKERPKYKSDGPNKGIMDHPFFIRATMEQETAKKWLKEQILLVLSNK